MARVIAVHGIGQQVKGAHTLHADWLPALRDGLARADVTRFAADDLACTFYGDLFRPAGAKALAGPAYDARDVESGWELQFLEALWAEASRVEPSVPGPAVAGKARTSTLAQRALGALAASRFFVGLVERVMVADLKQVRAYLHDDDVRSRVHDRVAAAFSNDTTVVIGHSLGSVIAYEVLAANPDLEVEMLVTLGSPLGIPNLIFDRLRPAPLNGKGAWPGTTRRWVNVADRGDVVALTKELAPSFGDRVEDRLVHNGAMAHDARPYLTAVDTGLAIAAGLQA